MIVGAFDVNVSHDHTGLVALARVLTTPFVFFLSTGGTEVCRTALAGPAGLLQARFRSAVPPPRLVPLPAHVQGHQGRLRLFLSFFLFISLFDGAHPYQVDTRIFLFFSKTSDVFRLCWIRAHSQGRTENVSAGTNSIRATYLYGDCSVIHWPVCCVVSKQLLILQGKETSQMIVRRTYVTACSSGLRVTRDNQSRLCYVVHLVYLVTVQGTLLGLCHCHVSTNRAHIHSFTDVDTMLACIYGLPFVQDKFVPTGSKRLQAYQRLGLVQKSELDRMLDKHLPTTGAPAFNPAIPMRMPAAAPAVALSGMPQQPQQQPFNGSNSAAAATVPVGL